MADHLMRRGGVWWVRLVVPARLRTVAGRREFTRSCRTSDIRAAKVVAATHLGAWRRQLLAIDPNMQIDLSKLLEPAPALAVMSSVTLDDVEAAGIDRDVLLQQQGVRLSYRLQGVLGAKCLQADFERDASGVCDVADLPPNAEEVEYSGLCELADSDAWVEHIQVERPDELRLVAFSLGQGWLFIPSETHVVKVGRLEVPASMVNDLRKELLSHVSPDERQRVLQPIAGREATLLPPVSKKLLSEAIDVYRDDPSGLPGKLKHADEQRQQIGWLRDFVDYMGDLELGQITPEVLRQFRDGPLKTFPANANNVPKAYKGKSIHETAKRLAAAGVDWPTMTDKAQSERMEKIAAFFKWVAENRRWLNENPAAPLKGEHGTSKADRLEAKRQQKEHGEDEEGRRAFAEEELAKVFKVPHYQTGDGRHVTRGNEFWYPFQYWLPLLALYHGCRISELCQLHLDDVRRDDGVWLIDINDRTKDKSIKTDNTSARCIPLHPRVVELGFVEYCQQLRAAGFRRVFPELSYSMSAARYAKEAKRKMSKMLGSLGMPRDGTLVFHNFRHTANFALGRAQVPGMDEHLRTFTRYTLMGHKRGDDVNVAHYSICTMAERLALVAAVAHTCTAQVARFDVGYGVAQVRLALSRKKDDRKGVEDMAPLSPDFDARRAAAEASRETR